MAKKKIDESVLDELLKGCERPEDLLGDGGLMKDLKKALMQRMLGAELAEHLGYEHGHEPPIVQSNRRNGVSRKCPTRNSVKHNSTLRGGGS